MKIRNKKAWKTAQWEYEELVAQGMMPFFGDRLPPEEIIEQLEMIIKDCPNFYPALLDLELRKLAAGGNGGAERRLEEGFYHLLELAEPEHMEEELDNLIENLEKLWRFDLSSRFLKVLVERHPRNASFQDSLAHATARTGDVNGALHYVDKAVELEPENPHFRSNQGWLHMMAGNLEEAREALEAAAGLDPVNEVVKGNLEIYDYLKEHGGNYFDYLLRPAERERIEQLADEEAWEEVDRLCASYNTCRFEAMAQAFLQGDEGNVSRLADKLATLREFFGFVGKVDQDGHLNEDLAFIHEYFEPIMHKFIFKFYDIDREMIEEIYEALIEYYNFLASRKLVPFEDLKRFQKKIFAMKKKLLEKMQRYNQIRHNDDISDEEKEVIREELFEGDHVWPFL
jgi:tetratricopeptide (TPR) repeat protein